MELAQPNKREKEGEKKKMNSESTTQKSHSPTTMLPQIPPVSFRHFHWTAIPFWLESVYRKNLNKTYIR